MGKFYGALIVASTSTPSTRRLLDGVAMPVAHRSMEPAQHGRVVAETPVDFHTGNDPQVQQPGVPAEPHVVRGAHALRRVDLHRGEEPPAAIDQRPLLGLLLSTAADGP